MATANSNNNQVLMNAPRISQLELYRYQINLAPHLPVAKQRIDIRHGLVIAASLTSGQQSFVEIAPLSGTDIEGVALSGFSHESLDAVIEQLTTLLPRLIGSSLTQINEILASAELYPSAAFGLSLLALKLDGGFDHPQYDYAQSMQSKIGLFYYQPDSDLNKLRAKLAQLDKRSYSVKVKVAQASIEQEIKYIHQILELNPKLKLRLDANQGFTPEQAIEFLACLPKAAIEYIEEPCKTPAENQQVYQALKIPFALDESLNDSKYQFDMLEGLTALVIKPTIIGSINQLTGLITTANSHGVRCILSSSLEANLGINDLAKLSYMLTPDETPGLDTLSSFSEPLIDEQGQLNKAVCVLLQRETISEATINQDADLTQAAALNQASILIADSEH
ncbi:o-succinylbenzoate synthase [Shewanella sp. 10N.286.52.C2]|uniref:o-succinylbenzoate synthase n=1 Tax=Shewanella sp. 10N.286.52.C2 TaxID=1880838 RepID=UPI001F5392C9|nr:o-succinylbenzoate synthase [Shewanella sp. 10N.286.52.C2]